MTETGIGGVLIGGPGPRDTFPPLDSDIPELPVGNGSLDGSTSGRSTPSLGIGSPQNGNPSNYDSKLFVGGLSWQTTPEKLRDYFTKFGTVVDVLVMKDPVTQRSRGFGFITFAEAVTVSRVLAVPNHMLDGKRIDPKHATPRSKPGSSKTKKIFVGGVSQDTTLADVQTYFSQFGKLDEAVMLIDQQTKRHRGFGFVTFEVEDVVDRICEIRYHTIKGKKVECKRAQPKETGASLNVLAKRMIVPLTGSPMAAQGTVGGLGLPPMAAAAVASYAKLMGRHSAGLGGFRFSPYALPTIASAHLPTLSYGAYQTLPASIDVSSLPSIDWSSDWSSVYNAF